MKILQLLFILPILIFNSCSPKKGEQNNSASANSDSFNFIADRFADIQVLRYQIPGFEKLSLKDKKLAYYLYQAGLSGRDIFYDQKYKHGLRVRKALEAILNEFSDTKSGEEWDKFLTYSKRFFFSNGIYHHYSSDKILPEFNFEYFSSLISGCDPKTLPLDGMTTEEFLTLMKSVMFDPSFDPKGVDLSAKDVIKSSANNFYVNVDQHEAENYYLQLKQITASQENKLEAMRGLLRCQYKQEKWSEAVENAKELTEAKGSSADDKTLANMAIGKSYQVGGQYDQAIANFKAVVLINKAAMAAEARYEIANCWFHVNKLTESEKAAFETINK